MCCVESFPELFFFFFFLSNWKCNSTPVKLTKNLHRRKVELLPFLGWDCGKFPGTKSYLAIWTILELVKDNEFESENLCIIDSYPNALDFLKNADKTCFP